MAPSSVYWNGSLQLICQYSRIIFYDLMTSETGINDNLCDKKNKGFRPNDSTTSTTAFFINDVYDALNKNVINIAVYIDATKAFDTVKQEILLYKLEYF